ncbi:ribonuclease III domain-containing protein [Artemisia annua]|uniref:Ribonuclease III domain-containing protein n=1 Tax=Artemisia annua TaxID=35608 RepID=A0A2U1NXC1_ARTAN|nr:ribonuclease III domain-containing protein [Artemisia annua]
MQLRSNIPLCFILAVVITASVLFSSPTVSAQPHSSLPNSGSFSDALDMVQMTLQYRFKKIEFLRIALTHSSYSAENNKVFSILGNKVMKITLVLQSLKKDLDISPDDLNDKISKFHSSCAAYGMFLKDVVRVSSTTDSSASSVVCGALRAIFGAIALDNGEFADAINVFLVLQRFNGEIMPYYFKNLELGYRSVVHSSYSEKNNKAMSILGESIIEAAVTLKALAKNVDLSKKDLNHYISLVSDVDSCAHDGRLLKPMILVSENIDPSTSSIVCGAYRAFVGAIVLDKGKPDDGVGWYWDRYGHSGIGKADELYM